MAIPVPQLLAKLGIKSKRQGHKHVALCPDPAHPDRNPSWSIVDDPRSALNGSHTCFSCGFTGGPWELAAAVLGLDLKQGGEWVRANFGNANDTPRDLPLIRVAAKRPGAAEFNLPSGVHIPSLDGSEWFAPAFNYLTQVRRVPDWQIQRWHIGFALRGRCAWRVVIPVHTNDRLVSYTARAFVDDGRSRYDVARADDPGAKPGAALFGEPAFDDDSVVSIAEGAFGMLALERAGYPNPCAVLGAKNLGPEKLKILASFETALVCTDPDRAGDEAFEKIEKSLSRYVRVKRVRLSCSPDDATDAELRQALSDAIGVDKPRRDDDSEKQKAAETS